MLTLIFSAIMNEGIGVLRIRANGKGSRSCGLARRAFMLCTGTVNGCVTQPLMSEGGANALIRERFAYELFMCAIIVTVAKLRAITQIAETSAKARVRAG
jgi:hypothetical protein